MHEAEICPGDLVGDLDALEALVQHHHLVQLDAQQPGALQLGLEVRFGHQQVGLHQIYVIFNDGGLRVRIVPAPSRGYCRSTGNDFCDGAM